MGERVRRESVGLAQSMRLALVLVGFGSLISFHCQQQQHQVMGAKIGGRQQRSRLAASKHIACGEYVRSANNKQLGGPVDRIFGGRSANPGEVPFQVLLGIEGHSCGGVIIGEHLILTAAHCLVDFNLCKKKHVAHIADPSRVKVTIGTHDSSGELYPGQILTATQLVVHEKYCSGEEPIHRNDIALIKTAQKMTWNLTESGYGSVNRICLPKSQHDYHAYQPVLISGWGGTEISTWTRILQIADVELLGRDKCRSDLNFEESYVLGDGQVCINTKQGKGIYKGDSGGPSFKLSAYSDQVELVGLTSFVFGKTFLGVTKAPIAIQTYVAHYLDWIEHHRERLAQD